MLQIHSTRFNLNLNLRLLIARALSSRDLDRVICLTLNRVSDASLRFTPSTLEELLKLKAEFPQAKLIVGCTEVCRKLCRSSNSLDIRCDPDWTAIAQLAIAGSCCLAQI